MNYPLFILVHVILLTPTIWAKQIYKVGFLLESFQEQRYELDKSYFIQSVQARGGEVLFQSAQGRADLQLKQIRVMIEQKIEVLVIQAVKEEVICFELKQARTKGLLVIAYDRPLPEGCADKVVTHDSQIVGRLQAEQAIKEVPNLKDIFICAGPQNNQVAQEITEANKKKMQKNGAKVNIKFHEYWSSQQCQVSLLHYLEERTPQAILANNSSMAVGVADIYSARGESKQVFIAGADLNRESCRRLRDNEIQYEVFKPIRPLAEAAAEMVKIFVDKENLRDPQRIVKIPVVGLTRFDLLHRIEDSTQPFHQEIKRVCDL